MDPLANIFERSYTNSSRATDQRLQHPPVVTDQQSDRSIEQREQEELLEALKRATVGEYDIYSPLGRGGMATVFLALELALNRPVAIKVISPAALSSTTVIERFWLEARTAASLSHPHVIPIYAVRAVHGLHFFVMKHVQGGSLDVVLKNEGAFSFDLARTVLMHVAGALAYAHRRGVVHRDIKPANIMLDDEGYAIVMDFGIAKVRDVAALTASGAMVGTPQYMSPEQFSGETIDGRTDQYSLGIVAYELITGKKPFAGKTVPEVLRGHLLEKAPDIRDVRSDCPTSLATLINRMLCKLPSDRFPSMEAVFAQLERMPRMNADKIREEIASFAKTASLSNPQISEPLSPTPLGRVTSPGAREAANRPHDGSGTHRNYTRTAWIAVALLAITGSVFAASTQFGRGTLEKKLGAQVPVGPQPAFLTTPATTKRDSLPTAKTDAAPSVSSPGQANPAPIDVLPNFAAPVRSVRKLAKGPQAPTKKVDTDSTAGISPSAMLPFAAPAQEPAPQPKSPTAFKVGSRLPQAVFYVDGELVGMRSGRTTFVHPPGVVHLQIRAEDCASYDTVFVLSEGDTAQIGWRNPKCK
jgi:serine/threonine protein kinase